MTTKEQIYSRARENGYRYVTITDLTVCSEGFTLTGEKPPSWNTKRLASGNDMNELLINLIVFLYGEADKN